MTAGLIVFAVMVAIQGLLFLIGAAMIIAFLVKAKSDKLYLIAFILWATGPLFSVVGAFFGAFL